MATTSKEAAAGLIGGLYTIDFTQPLAHVAPPLAAFAAHRSGLTGYMAVSVQRGWPVRVRALGRHGGLRHPRTSCRLWRTAPAAMPNGTIGYFIICPAPPGPSLLATLRPWPEAELTDFVLKAHGARVGRVAGPDGDASCDPGGQPVPSGAAYAGDAGLRLGHAPRLPPAQLDGTTLLRGMPAGRAGRRADRRRRLRLGRPHGDAGAGQKPRWKACRTTKSCGASWISGATPPWSATIACHRAWSTWCAACWPMTRSIGRRRRCWPTPPPPARAGSQRGPPAGRNGRSTWAGRRRWTARMLAHAMVRAPEIAGPMLRNGTIDRWLRRGVGDVAARRVHRRGRAPAGRRCLGSGRPGRRPAHHPCGRDPRPRGPTGVAPFGDLAGWAGQRPGPCAQPCAGAGGRPGGDRHRPCGERLGRTAGKRRGRGGGTVRGYGNPPLVHRGAQWDGSLAAVLPPEPARPLRVACHRPGLGDPFVGPVASLGGERRPGTAGATSRWSTARSPCSSKHVATSAWTWTSAGWPGR